MRRRARQINRARESGEENRHSVGKEILPKFLLLLLLRHFHFSRKTFHEQIRQLRFPTNLFSNFPRAEILFSGQEQLRSRTHVQKVICF